VRSLARSGSWATSPGQDIAIQLYTSGTAGRPKGALLTHDNIMAGLSHVASGVIGRWAETGEVNIVCLPMFHIGGAGWGLNGLFAGATDVIPREADPGRTLRVFADWRVNKAGSCRR